MCSFESNKFEDNILTSEKIKVEPPESPLNNEDILLDTDSVSETNPKVIEKKEIEINYETPDGESETFQLDSEIKIEHEEIVLKKELMKETNEISDVESLKSNIKDFENIFVQSTEEVVDVKEENQELIEDPLREGAGEESNEGQGHFEFIGVNHFLSKSSEEKLNHVEKNVDSDSHMLIHSERGTQAGKEPLKCDICGKLFNHKGAFNTHKLTHTGEKPYKCDICGKFFARIYNLNIHKVIHTGEKPYKCDICGKSFNHKGALKTHKLIHTGEKPHKCDICGKLFARMQNLNTHKVTHTDEKPYKCDVCEKLFCDKANLKRHMIIHFNDKPHKCDVCGKLFSRKPDLKIHMLVHTGEKRHRCDICGKLFGRIYTLNLHKLIHTAEKPHNCDICGKQFRQKTSLNRHYSIHSGEKNH